MNFGDRKMQMSSAAVPAMRTSPMLLSAPPRAQALRDDLQADAARRLDEHGVARRARARATSAAAAGRVVGARARSPPNAPPSRAASGPTRDEHVDAALARVARRSRAWKRASSGPSSSMSPSTATRRPDADAARSSRAARIDIGLAL